MVYPVLLPLMRTPRLPVVKWTDAPADLNGLVRFAERPNLVSARVPSHFKRSLRKLFIFWIISRGNGLLNPMASARSLLSTRSLQFSYIQWRFTSSPISTAPTSVDRANQCQLFYNAEWTLMPTNYYFQYYWHEHTNWISSTDWLKTHHSNKRTFRRRVLRHHLQVGGQGWNSLSQADYAT
jgi:hypothetical protein